MKKIPKNDILKWGRGVLSKKEIVERLFHKDPSQRLCISPIINQKNQINNGSVDVRLGTEFIISKRTRYPVLDPKEEDTESRIEEYQDKEYVRLGKKLILHPHQFVLGSTLEYLRFPNDLLGYVIGRSSWGRLGLVIATATLVNPGFVGVITLELVNIGDTPITLYPGIRIAQLAIHKLTTPDKSEYEKVFKSKYTASVGPEFSRIYTDDEWKIWRKF